jgi:hypothetical protein
MSLLSVSRRVSLLVVAVSSLLGVACSGANDQPTYTATDIELNAEKSGSIALQGCTTGATQSCTIFLGRHGDLENCVEGLDVCSAGAWTGCIDEAAFVENPELVSQLSAQ